MGEVASIIGEVLKNAEDDAVKEKAGQRVRDLMQRFPLYAYGLAPSSRGRDTPRRGDRPRRSVRS